MNPHALSKISNSLPLALVSLLTLKRSHRLSYALSVGLASNSHALSSTIIRTQQKSQLESFSNDFQAFCMLAQRGLSKVFAYLLHYNTSDVFNQDTHQLKFVAFLTLFSVMDGSHQTQPLWLPLSDPLYLSECWPSWPGTGNR